MCFTRPRQLGDSTTKHLLLQTATSTTNANRVPFATVLAQALPDTTWLLLCCLAHYPRSFISTKTNVKYAFCFRCCIRRSASLLLFRHPPQRFPSFVTLPLFFLAHNSAGRRGWEVASHRSRHHKTRTEQGGIKAGDFDKVHHSDTNREMTHVKDIVTHVI